MSGAGEAGRGGVVCGKCRHRCAPVRLHWAPQTGNPEVMRQLDEWERHLMEVEQAERELFAMDRPFIAPPQFYEWCLAWTDALIETRRRDHNGRPMVVYEICARHNRANDCVRFEAGAPDDD